MNKKRENQKVVDIIGYPCDLGAGRRGVDMGPSALRIAGITRRIEALGYRVHDRGDISILPPEQQNIGNPKLRYMEEILKTSSELAGKVEAALDNGHFPLCLGGDHSMALGTVAGIASHCIKRNQRLGIIWIDAHTDMNTDETTPSGNIHGMPLAALLGFGNQALTEFRGFSPKVDAAHAVVIGARSIDREEKINIKSSNLTVYTMNDVDKLGIHRIVTRVLKQLKQTCDHIHVSFDVDSIDPLIVPGVGTPIPGGLNYREAHLLMETIAECGCMTSLEVSEINPILDNQNKSAEFAVDIIASSLGQTII